MSAELQKSAVGLIDEIKAIIGQSDPVPAMLQQKTDQLQQVLLQIGSAVYQSAPGAKASDAFASTFSGNTLGQEAGKDSSSWTSFGNEDTFIGDDSDETVITDYEVVD